MSLIAQRIVHETVLASGGVEEVLITKQMIHAVRSSGTIRNEFLKQKADEEAQKTNTLKRVNSEIKELEIKNLK